MIERPLELPCGVTLANRLCKSAMAEGLARPTGRATPAHQKLYAAWAAGGALPGQPSKDFGRAMARRFA